MVEFEKDKRVLAYKNVTCNEPFFTGHFPGHPVMPGVLVVEALAQAGGLLTQLSRDPSELGKDTFYLVKVDNARFSKTVGPGDQLVLDVTLDRMKAGIFKFKARAKVGDDIATEAELMCTMRTIA